MSGLRLRPLALALQRVRTTSSGPNKPGRSGASIEKDATALAGEADETTGNAPTALSEGHSQRGTGATTGARGPRQQVAQVGMMLGRYELVSELGEGGMASVFGARDTKLGRDVAVKVMFPHLARRKEAASRFKREARAAAGLDHEHILRVFDVGGGEVVDNVLVPPYIVLERIDGASLDDFFREHEPPLAEVVAAMGVALCRGLAQAHASNIVHRDIKPANVMVTNKGRLVLADFGVARVGGDEDDSVVTRTGAVLGTPAYMSPEQASGDPVDARSDLYSLGASLYRIATGSVPYAGSAAQIVAGILDGKKVPAEQRDPRIGRELSRVIDKLMQIDPDQRYANAEEVEEALLAIVEGGGVSDSEELLAAYVCDPSGMSESTIKTVISASLVRARRLSVAGRGPAAVALAERVLALSPENIQAQALCNSLGQTRRDRKLWLAIFGPMVVTAAVGAVFWGSRPGPISSYADGAPSDAWQAPADAGSAASIDPVPLALPARDASVVVIDAAPKKTTATGSRPRIKTKIPAAVDAAPAPAPRPDAALASPAAVEPASLIVHIVPWCDVWIDGDKRSRASKKTTYQLEPGSYQIECKQPGTDLAWAKRVTLGAGEHKTLTGSVIPPVTIAVRLKSGQEVQIGSKRIRNGQSASIPAGRHRVQVWKGGKPLKEAKFMDLRASCIMRDEPKLICSSR